MKINKQDYDLVDIECVQCGDNIKGVVSEYWLDRNQSRRMMELREVRDLYPEWDDRKKVKKTEAESLAELGYS
jgi:hypothetical protein